MYCTVCASARCRSECCGGGVKKIYYIIYTHYNLNNVKETITKEKKNLLTNIIRQYKLIDILYLYYNILRMAGNKPLRNRNKKKKIKRIVIIMRIVMRIVTTTRKML